MEDICIPKLSVLMTYDNIFTDMTKFCAFTGYKPQSTFTDNIEVVRKQKQSALSVSSMFRTLRNSFLNKTRQEYSIIREEDVHSDTILSHDLHQELRVKKNLLLRIINKHEAAMSNLREARVKCWKTQAKLEKYSLIIATQRSALLHNQQEKELREEALQKMKVVFDKYMIEHNKDHVHFEKSLLAEIRLREKIQKISRDMASEISHVIYDVIGQLLDRNNQLVGCDELEKLVNTVYKQACRVYTFQTVENSPCNKEWIQKPTYKACDYKKKDMASKMTDTKPSKSHVQYDAEIMGNVTQSVS